MLVYAGQVTKQEPLSVSTGGDEVEPGEEGSASLSNVCGTTGRKAGYLRLWASFLDKHIHFRAEHALFNGRRSPELVEEAERARAPCHLCQSQEV